MQLSERKTGTPEVKAERSLLEIVENFTDPREVLREAISNSLDWSASTIRITVHEDATRADRELVIKIWDDGLGLDKERFFAFWNLADSVGLQRDKFGRKMGQRVGEKGHGTKTFWKCRQIEVESVTRDGDGNGWHVLGEMREPIDTLLQEKVPNYEYAEGPEPSGETFTEVTIKGYKAHRKEDFRHETLKDYIQWFTKFGAIELDLQNETHKGKVIELQGLGQAAPETITFGHPFPPVFNDIKQLRKQYQDTWPKYYVNKWVFSALPIEGYPSSTIDVVFYLEGDSVKRQYNPMLTRPGRPRDYWHYTVSDRYGLYVCKDWIPLPTSQRVNEWVAEKSEWTLYHAFVNCQDFELTANRGSIGNTDRDFILKVREAVENLFKSRIRASQEYQVYEEEIGDTKRRSAVEHTEEGEKEDLDTRFFHAKKKRIAQYQCPRRPTVVLTEPRQEVEVLILFSAIKALRPDLFEFDIVDYSTSRGIDALCALEPAQGGLQKGNVRYVEFKKALTHEFRDHTFARLAAMVWVRWTPSVGQDRGYVKIGHCCPQGILC
ncbi:MAG: ATP-binding protein [Dehalococcoidia bacterium]|nr:ATP-binding protein [Dehalococcoidia bacterium]